MYLSYTVVLVVGALLLAFQYSRNQRLRMDLIEEQSTGDVRMLNLAVGSITERLQSLTDQAEGSLRIGDRHRQLQQMLDAFMTPASILALDGYALDTLPAHLDGKLNVNVTGLGRLRALRPAVREEIAMAVALEPSMNSILDSYPSLGLIFYISNQGFRVGAPRSLSTERAINPSFRAREYFENALPAVNPERKAFWTLPYEDSWSYDQTLTLSQPVYNDTVFHRSDVR